MVNTTSSTSCSAMILKTHMRIQQPELGSEPSKRNMNYSFGSSWQQAGLEGKIKNGIKDSVITKQFNNLLPNARFQYNFSKFKNLSINYSTTTNQPTVSQLQPVPDNSNPLNIRLGNPDLKQEYSHNIQGGLQMVSPYKNKNMFAFFRMQTTQNKIVNYDEVDQLGDQNHKTSECEWGL
jgi:hypothetical protein